MTYSRILEKTLFLFITKRLTDLLMLFIFTNNYNYTFDVANIWINNVRGLFDNIPQSTRTRSILLLEEYGQNNRFTRIKSVMPSSDFYSIPEWCKEAAFDYEARKIKEGWSNSTLDMIRSSITRFCNIVHSFGVRSYKDITADIIKRFNIKDEHKTPEGKNAYNTRIRKFLIYLGEHGYLSNQMLFIALSTSGAHKEKIVVILSEEEMDQMKESLSDDSGLSLRKKAMLLLGLKMGLRSIDVVNLQYNNINWFTETIHFIQKKTDVEVELPMPPEVGNALYEYINKERPKVKNQSIFLSEYAPFEQVNRTSCQVALKDALPDREVPGSGFHVTRKTYASELLRNGVPADKVAEALGQIGTTSVHRYLSLDEERMAMCSLDFDDCFIGGVLLHHI